MKDQNIHWKYSLIAVLTLSTSSYAEDILVGEFPPENFQIGQIQVQTRAVRQPQRFVSPQVYNRVTRQQAQRFVATPPVNRYPTQFYTRPQAKKKHVPAPQQRLGYNFRKTSFEPASPQANTPTLGGNPFTNPPAAKQSAPNQPQAGFPQFPPKSYAVNQMQPSVQQAQPQYRNTFSKTNTGQNYTNNPAISGRFPQNRSANYRAPNYQYPSQVQRQQQPARAMNSYPQRTYNRPSNQTAPSFSTPNMNYRPQPFNYQSPSWQMSRMTPFGNGFSPTAPFANSNMMPNSPWGNSSSWFNPWKSWNQNGVPYFPQYQYQQPNKKKAWGDVRNIWPDFYTGFTEDMWDTMINAPYDLGRMPGGWRAPTLSSPDPVTVGDAVTNQFPPMFEEMGNMMNFAN